MNIQFYNQKYLSKAKLNNVDTQIQKTKTGNRITIYNYHSITRQRPCDHDYCAPTLHLRKFSTYSVDDVSYEKTKHSRRFYFSTTGFKKITTKHNNI